MSWSDYNEFLDVAKELYDFDHSEAQEFYREFRDESEGTPTAEDLYTYPETATEIASEVLDYEWVEEEEEPEYFYSDWEDEYDLDYSYFDDEWLDTGDEIEITFDKEYDSAD